MNFLQITYPDLEHVKGYIEYFHNGKQIDSSAFDISSKAELKLVIPRFLAVDSVICEIYNESLSQKLKIRARLKLLDEFYDCFTVDLKPLGLGVGLYFFRIVIKTPFCTLYGYRDGKNVITSSNPAGNMFQLTVTGPQSNATEKYQGGIIYHIFVDRFHRAGNYKPRPDAIMRDDWNNGIPDFPEYPGAYLENNTFFGGTLDGVTDKLPYLKKLGVTLVYLSPIFEAYSNHKYDTADYMTVDSMFGGEPALRNLIKEAKKLGIGIILDGVFNHTGADSVYFNRYGKYSNLGAYQSKDSEYFNWYEFKKFPNEYTCWWGIEILPRINPDIKECGEFIAGQNGVVEKYSKLGIAGFRLDVADELSDEFISKIKAKLREVNPNGLLYGEVWEDASNKIAYGKRKKYYLGNELDAVMNYPLRTGIIEYLRDKNVNSLRQALDEIFVNAPVASRNVMMNLLGTHDTPRIITVLAGKSSEGKTNAELATIKLTAEEKMRGEKMVAAAYTILATLPGLPTVYYGDEAGLEGYSDPFNRRPYPWDAASKNLRKHYVKVGKIRTVSEVYKNGSFKIAHLDSDVFAFLRQSGKKVYMTVLNNSDFYLKLSFDSAVSALIEQKRGRELLLKPYCSEIINTNNSKLATIKKTGEPI